MGWPWDPDDWSGENYSDDGTLCRQRSWRPTPFGTGCMISKRYIPCLLLDAPDPPQPPAPPPQAKAPAPAPTPTPQPTPATATPSAPSLDEQVSKWLDKNNFTLPIVSDVGHAYFNWDKRSREDIIRMAKEEFPQASDSDIRFAVLKAFRAKQLDAEKTDWQVLVSVLWTPQYNVWTSQPQSSPLQNSGQFSIGHNKRYHRFDTGGFETTLSLNGSFFNLAQSQNQWLQNALAAYQLSYVAPLGPQFDFGFIGLPDVQAYIQGSIFAQIGLGVGATYADDTGKMYLGFMAQPNVGGQLTLTLSFLQVILSGSAVYSWTSPTAEPNSKPTSSLGGQLGLGIAVPLPF